MIEKTRHTLVETLINQQQQQQQNMSSNATILEF